MIQKSIIISTRGKGLHSVTKEVLGAFEKLPEVGMLNIFIQHTSASLLIQENYDPTAQEDLETFLEKLVPENQSWHVHTVEGSDDTTSHLKSAITPVSLNIPISQGKISLGRWQGIYLWEHRSLPHKRTLILTVF